MVAVSINDVFQHGSGGDFFIKDITGNSIKTIYFDVDFASDEEYDTSEDLDFSRYFTKLVSAEATNSTITIGRYVPHLALAATDGHATLSIVDLGTTAAAGVADKEDEASDVVSATETAIRGKTITVRVVGY